MKAIDLMFLTINLQIKLKSFKVKKYSFHKHKKNMSIEQKTF